MKTLLLFLALTSAAYGQIPGAPNRGKALPGGCAVGDIFSLTQTDLLGNAAGLYTATSAGPPCVWAAASGGSSATSMTIFGAINATAYGVKADGHLVSGPTFTNTSNIVTCTGCNFTGTDAQNRPNAVVGQVVFGTNATSDVSALTSVLVTPECLIQSIDSATQIHMGTVGAIGTACNATATTSSSGFIAWGDLDSATAAQTPSTANDPLLNAWTVASTNCQSLALPSGVMLVERGEFLTGTGPCSVTNRATFYRSGYAIYGQGPSATILIPTPSFVAADCTAGCFFGASSNPEIQELQLTGIGNSACGAGFNGKKLVQITGDATTNGTNFSIRHVIFQGWCAAQAGTIGLQIGSGVSTISGGLISDSIFETFGITGVNTNYAGGASSVSIQSSNNQYTGCGNSGCLIINSGIWNDTNGIMGYTNSTTSNAVLISGPATGNFVNLYMPYITGAGVSQIGVISGSLKLTNALLTGSAQAIGTGGTTNLIFSGSLINGSSNSIGCAGASVICNIYDLGGNTFGGNILGGGGGVTNVWQSSSITGTACATGNWALTSGWGASAVATASGDSHRCHMTITGAAGSAGPVLTWTYPKAYLVAPLSCQLTGLNASLTGVTSGVPTASTVAFTFTGTPAAVTYTFDADCGP